MKNIILVDDLHIEYDPCYIPYSVKIFRYDKETKKCDRMNPVEYRLLDRRLSGVGNDAVCIALVIMTNDGYEYYIDFKNRTAENLTKKHNKFIEQMEMGVKMRPFLDEDDEYDDDNSRTKENKVKRIGKRNYDCADDEFTVYMVYKDIGIVVDWVDKKIHRIEDYYVVEDVDTFEEAEEKFFKESCMMTYDYSSKTEEGVIFVKVEEEKNDEE